MSHIQVFQFSIVFLAIFKVSDLTNPALFELSSQGCFVSVFPTAE